MEKQKPIHEVRIGRIKAAIWANDSDQQRYYNVQLGRLYKKGDEWMTTDSFGRDDLPVLCKVIDKAFEYILEAPKQVETEDSE